MVRSILILALALAPAGPALAQPGTGDTCTGRIAITQVDHRLMAKTGPNAGAIGYSVTLTNLTPQEQSYTLRLAGFEGLANRPSGSEVRRIAAGATRTDPLGIAHGFAVSLPELRAAIRLACR